MFREEQHFCPMPAQLQRFDEQPGLDLRQAGEFSADLDLHIYAHHDDGDEHYGDFHNQNSDFDYDDHHDAHPELLLFLGISEPGLRG